MATGFYYDERCMWHSQGEHALYLPVGGCVEPPSNPIHVENGFTKRRFRNLVEVSGLMARLEVASAPPALRADLERVHPASYLDRFKALSDAGGGDMGEDARFSPGGYEIAALAAGLVIRGVADVMSGAVANAYVLTRPPGHHCLPGKGMGFCLLANIPVALEALRARLGPVRVAVVDWDVHHGNGTEAIYYDRDDTLTISLHQEACYPIDSGRAGDRGRGPGEGFNLNVPLLPGGGHRAYLDAMEVLVVPALRAFRPDLIVVASGLDASGVDPLARMLAHSDTFREMTRILMAEAGTLCGGRLVAAHEGGYSELYVPFCGLAIMEELAGHRTGVEDPLLASLVGNQPAADMAAFQRARLEAQARDVFG
ncbi:class II histone deacetylase [Defluviimonas sp. WL0075]|uniref:Class II histone deacetylase n=1 Tax=Albidovulum sediminicola TaxID=2984331 RepID=A0ABT2YXQ0_9RHOB|nr:class II histone deacetylase [Defluviimonas sp. WL0075]MCV2863651.1 class II histone deacetylase [Defluviimonas sp. WL0075]